MRGAAGKGDASDEVSDLVIWAEKRFSDVPKPFARKPWAEEGVVRYLVMARAGPMASPFFIRGEAKRNDKWF